MDLIKGLSRAQRSEKDSLTLSRYSTAGWAAALIVVAYASREVPFVFNAAFALTGLTSGALLGGLLAALFTKTGSAVPVIAGMLTSLAVMIVVQLKTNVAWPWFTLIGAAVTILVVLLAREVLARAKWGAKPPE
jgi:SSS family solute:Na+ symporter